MKFSYNWIREFVDGLDVPAEALERLITMKTAECEGVETVGRAAGRSRARARRSRRADRGQPQREGHGGCRALWPEDRGLRRAELPARHHDRLCSAGRRKRSPAWKATACWPAPPNSRSIATTPASSNSTGATGIARRPTASSRSTTRASRIGPDLWGHHGMAREVAAITGKPLRDPREAAICCRRPAAPVQVEIEDLDALPALLARWFSRTSQCSLRRFGCRSG